VILEGGDLRSSTESPLSTLSCEDRGRLFLLSSFDSEALFYQGTSLFPAKKLPGLE